MNLNYNYKYIIKEHKMMTIKEYINESLNNNEFTCNISQVQSGKRNDALLFNKIQKSLESKKDTYVTVDCGKAGLCEIEFSNFENNICNISLRLKDLGKYMKFSKKVNSEWTNKGTYRDLYNTMLIILRNIQNKLYN